MKFSKGLLAVWFFVYSLLGEDVIENKVVTKKDISTLEISSSRYNISNIELNLVHQQDDMMIDGKEEKGSIVVSPDDDVKAFGYIDDGRFFGQFTFNNRTFFVDPLPSGQEGAKLIPWDELKGLICKDLLTSYSRIIHQVLDQGGKCWRSIRRSIPPST